MVQTANDPPTPLGMPPEGPHVQLPETPMQFIGKGPVIKFSPVKPEHASWCKQSSHEEKKGRNYAMQYVVRVNDRDIGHLLHMAGIREPYLRAYAPCGELVKHLRSHGVDFSDVEMLRRNAYASLIVWQHFIFNLLSRFENRPRAEWEYPVQWEGCCDVAEARHRYVVKMAWAEDTTFRCLAECEVCHKQIETLNADDITT